MTILYNDLTPTTERGAVCRPCSEYKGMMDCPECGETFCIYCNDSCPGCFATIVFRRYN